jgi:MoaA/NifB/PqqE/SkfB family radical SAM enzyme
LCPTGAGEHGRPISKMDFSDFRKIIDAIGNYLYEVNLFDFGEPFLNEELPLMIEYAHKKNISTCIGTNVTLLDDRISEFLVKSGLDHLSISIDGLSSETYSKYRVGGDFRKVIENLKCIVNWKRKLNSPLPFIEWQFLVFKHNQHEVEKVKHFARALGADGVYIRSARVGADVRNRDKNLCWTLEPGEKLRKKYPEEEIGGGRACDFLYFTFTLNPEGGVSPCCLAYKKEEDFDNLYQERSSFQEVWNNDKFKAARSIFHERRLSSREEVVCNACHVTKDFLQI